MSRRPFSVTGKGHLLVCVVLMVLIWLASPLLAQPQPDEAGTTAEVKRISLWITIVRGGFIGLLIILMSVVSLSLVIEHFVSIRRERVVPPLLIDQLETQLDQRQYEQAQQACTQNPSFLATVVGTGLERRGSMFGHFDMQNAMQEVSEREVSKLYRKLDYLSFIAATAPMLGLLGTVTGMIRSFNIIAVTEGTAKPSQLAGGISEALVTTCMGLIVAIPTMFFVSFFRNRVDSYVAETETVVEKLMGHFRAGTGKP
jgi:biopolymer transport protein ExbB